MSEEFYNRLALGEEGNGTVPNNIGESRSHRRTFQHSVQGNAAQSTTLNSRPYRIDNRVERTEVNLHLKHRTQRRAGSDSNSRGRYRPNEENRLISNIDDERKAHLSSSGLQYGCDERISVSYSNPNECDGTVLDGYMPEIPRAAPASKEQSIVVGGENTNARLERMGHYGGSEWNNASISSSLVSYNCEAGPYANYTEPSSKQAQLCPHVKGQQSLREDNNNVSCVSFGERDDNTRYSPSKHHIGNRCDRYIYHPDLERQYKLEHSTNGPPFYYYGIQTENMMRWKNNRDKNIHQIPGSSYGLKEKVTKSVPKGRYTSASDRNVNSSDSESGPSSSEREYWPNSYCTERRKKRVKRKAYRSKHYLGESDPSEHSDPGHHRCNEEFTGHICCASGSGDCDYDQQRLRSSGYLLNNQRRNISRSLTSVSSLDDDGNSLHSGFFTFNRISPRGKGKARISKINIKSFSTINVNPSRFNRASSSTSDIGNLDAQTRLQTLEKNVTKTTPRRSIKENGLMTGELSEGSCTSPSFKKSPFNSHLVGRKSSTSGSETPKHSPVPRICSPEIVDDSFKAPPSSSFKTIRSPDKETSSCFISGVKEQNTIPNDGAEVLKNLIENLEKDVESKAETVKRNRPESLPMKTNENTDDNSDFDVVTSPESMIASPVTNGGLFVPSENGSHVPPLSPGGSRVPSFLFGKDTPYTIQKPFVTLANIQEQDEGVYNSDGSTGHIKGKRERKKKISVDVEDPKMKDDDVADVVGSPRRRPSYVIAQNSGQMSPTPAQENKLEGYRTKPNGKDQTSYHEDIERKVQTTDISLPSSIQRSSKHEVQKVNKAVEGSAWGDREKKGSDKESSSDNSTGKRRAKKTERPRIPTILNLDHALDELFADVNKSSNATANPDETTRKVSRQESAPLLSSAVSESREQRKRSNSIDDPSSAVKLIASEADSIYMQRADGKVGLRHDKTDHEKSDIDKSLELLDELVVELSEKQPEGQGSSSERPALSRNVDGKSAGSASDVVMSPSQSQTSINSEKSTSGSDQIDKDVGISPLSEIYPSRYHSDPTPRVEKDYTTIQETIAEYDIKPRNSNSEPAINGKLLEEAADLVKAKAAEKENNSENKTGIERTSSSPADLQGGAPTQKLRRRESEKARRRQAAKAAQESGVNKVEDGSKSLQKQDEVEISNIENDSKTSKAGQAITPVVEHHTWPRIKPENETSEGTAPAPTTKKKKATKSEMRWHVVQNLLETEQSYVQNLQSLVKEYLNPLRKNESIVEPTLVNEMFYQIPEILKNHEVFLKQLELRVQDWTDKSKLGDIFVSAFTKCLLMDAYSQFINHFLRARAAVRSATLAKPGFLKYCEQRARDHKEKLTLQDLMIMPVQRIPRYVLIITDLLKYTPADHPDHGNLHLALAEIKTLADRMNKGELEADQAEKEAERLRDLEASIEGIIGRGGLTKKDRCLFLFSDLLVCATVKRKQTSLRRGSLSLFSGQSAAEMNKYRLLWQYPLDDVELVTTNGDLKGQSPEQILREKLEQDLNCLGRISKLAESVSVSHQALDDAIRDLASDLNRLLMEAQSPSCPSFQNKVELSIGSREPIDNYVFLFLSAEIKSSWEAYFLDAKQQLAYAKDSSPNFQNAIPINKSRSGLQFTCASPTVAPRLTKRRVHCGSGDVWVASSDGCVGQVSMLSPLREFEQGMTYSLCQSRILSISPVPGWKLVGINTSGLEYDFKDSGANNSSTLRSTVSKSSGYNSDENLRESRRSVSSTSKGAREEIIAFDSSTDEEEMGEDSFTVSPSPPSFDGRLSPEGSSLGTAGSLDGDLSSDGRDDSDFNENGSTDDERKARRKHEKKHMDGRCADVDDVDSNQQPTVWMGTEDGYIYILPVTSAVKQRRNKTKIQKAAAIQCILYVDNQVFVALANGDLCVYKRAQNYAWEINTPKTISISSNARITCMTAILGRLWVGCQNQVVVVNTTTLEIETRFNASMDSNRSLHAMASSGMGVWISVQSLSVIRLYHATSFEHLCDVDTKDAVHKMLAGSDAIIKQHKAACLRVTSLLTCKDLLWIGTSAGVVLTLPLPIIAPNTTSIQTPLDVTASAQGHTGHVRFLTAVEITKPDEKDEGATNAPATRTPRRPALNIDGKSNLQFASENVLIISGGDGYEDFKSTANESAGREDSTNHLLIWKV